MYLVVMVSVTYDFCRISSRLFEGLMLPGMYNWENGSVWHKDWPHKIYIGQWPIFHGPAVLFNILKTIWWRNVILGKMGQCDSKIDLMKYMLVSDLYFIVQWLCLIPWRLFDAGKSFSVTQRFCLTWFHRWISIHTWCSDTLIDLIKYMYM